MSEQVSANTAAINEMSEEIDTIASIAKGRNQAHVFSTTEAMQTWLSDVNNKGLYQTGDNLYIVDVDVPDWWIAEVLDDVDADTGYYYKIAQLETQKVDLTEIENELSAIKDNLSKNIAGQWVDILGYTSENKYLIPCDGYLYLLVGDAAHAYVYLSDANKNPICVIGDANSASASYRAYSLFAKKGMYVHILREGSANISLRFIPLE